MKRFFGITSALALMASVAAAANLNVTIRSGGTSTLTDVQPGAIVNYEVIGELTDALNEGLALWACDFAFDGGALTSGAAGAGMGDFVRDNGITNPAGYGGTTTVPGREGALVQAGGGMNTINNFAGNAQFPVGVVTTGIAQPGFPEVLMIGSLTAPQAPGKYLLTASNCFGNVIRQGENGAPFWATEPFGVGAITNLSITVAETCPQAASLNLATLAASEYPCQSTLSRTQNNRFRLQFDIGITAPVPGEIEIVSIDPANGAATSADLSGSFTFTTEESVPASGTFDVLKISENGQVLQNNTWYAISNVGNWCEAENFTIKYGTARGDADGLGGTGFNDLQATFNRIGMPLPVNAFSDSSRHDVDSLGGIGFNDLQTVFNNIPSALPLLQAAAQGCTP